MSGQITSHIIMIRPVKFRMNPETVVNNYYQKVIDGLTDEQAHSQALAEFDNFVVILRSHGIDVLVIEDTASPETPDSIFPNNWISFHDDGRIALYPMFAENRRLERREDITSILSEEGFIVNQITDFTHFESNNQYLEGTGSMLLDRSNQLVYAAISERTNPEVIDKFCQEFSYTPITFYANQTVEGKRLPIYHTNVMMCLTEHIAVICLDSIDDTNERKRVIDNLKRTKKEIIDISEEQVNQFAGNMLSLSNDTNERFLVMSNAAKSCLTSNQIDVITKHYKIIASSLDTIEALGGGSARCMMAEVFLPKK